MRDQQLQQQKEDLIKKDFLHYKKQNKYKTEYIINTYLVPKYFLAERTIQNIIFGQYDRRRTNSTCNAIQ